MAKRRAQSAHQVTFTVPSRPLGLVNIEFFVKKREKTFGRLLVSKGALVWLPRSGQHGYKIFWSQFDRFAQKEGRKGPGR